MRFPQKFKTICGSVEEKSQSSHLIGANRGMRIIVRANVICLHALGLSTIMNPSGVGPKPSRPLSTFSRCRETSSAAFLTSAALLRRMKPIPLSSWEIHTHWVSLESHWWAPRADSSGALALCFCLALQPANSISVEGEGFSKVTNPPLSHNSV